MLLFQHLFGEFIGLILIFTAVNVMVLSLEYGAEFYKNFGKFAKISDTHLQGYTTNGKKKPIYYSVEAWSL